jgi:hypothetical protein
MKTTTWPPVVNDYVDLVINIIGHELECDNEVCEKNLREEMSRLVFVRFVEGTEICLTDSEFEEAYKKALVKTQLDQLISKGILGYIEDDRGEEIVYLTEYGKRVNPLEDGI